MSASEAVPRPGMITRSASPWASAAPDWPHSPRAARAPEPTRETEKTGARPFLACSLLAVASVSSVIATLDPIAPERTSTSTRIGEFSSFNVDFDTSP